MRNTLRVHHYTEHMGLERTDLLENVPFRRISPQKQTPDLMDIIWDMIESKSSGPNYWAPWTQLLCVSMIVSTEKKALDPLFGAQKTQKTQNHLHQKNYKILMRRYYTLYTSALHTLEFLDFFLLVCHLRCLNITCTKHHFGEKIMKNCTNVLFRKD